MKNLILCMVILNLSAFFLITESLETHDGSGQKLSKQHSPSVARKIESAYGDASLRQAQAQTSKKSPRQASMSSTQPGTSLLALSNQAQTPKFKKPSTSRSASKGSFSLQEKARGSSSIKNQYLNKNIKRRANTSPLKQTSPLRSITESPSIPYATQKSSVKRAKQRVLAAKPSSSLGSGRSRHLSKSNLKKSKVSKSKENKKRKVSSSKSPQSNLPGSGSTSKIPAKSAAKKSQRGKSARSQSLKFKTKRKKINRLRPVSQRSTNAKFLSLPKHKVFKPHPSPSCQKKSPRPQIQTYTARPDQPISCARQTKEQPADHSVEAATLSYMAITTLSADTTTANSRDTDGVTTTVDTSTPGTKPLPISLSPLTTTSAIQIITQPGDATTSNQEITTTEGETIITITDTTTTEIGETTSISESTTVKDDTSMDEMDATTSVTSPTTTEISTTSIVNTAAETTTPTEAPRTMTTALDTTAFGTSTLGTTLSMSDISSSLPSTTTATITTADATSENDVGDSEEESDDAEDNDSVMHSEYNPELEEEFAEVPESNSTNPVTS